MSDSYSPDPKSSHFFALPIGTRIFEFEIVKVLGHGGFGITYLAIDTLLEEQVAIKEYLPNDLAVRASDSTVQAKSDGDQASFQDGLAAFLAEARMLARFRHPNIVQVRRFFEQHNTGYIVLTLERGPTLAQIMNERSLAENELRNIFDGVLEGLETVHNHAILHRDLKPSNIILRDGKTPVLIDFGAARDFQIRHSRSITTIATAGYAPPEQYGVGEGQLGPWTDIYALGAIAYQAICRKSPPDSLRRLRKDPMIPAAEIGKQTFNLSFLRTVDWMLKINEEDRPLSVQQVRQALTGSAQQVEIFPPAHDVHGEDDPTSKKLDEHLLPNRRRVVAGITIIAFTTTAGLGYFIFKNWQYHNRLTTLLAEANYSRPSLEKILEECALKCKPDIKSEAQNRIQILDAEAAEITAASNDTNKFRAYLAHCRACTSKSEALNEIARLERIDVERKERQMIAALQGRAMTLADYAAATNIPVPDVQTGFSATGRLYCSEQNVVTAHLVGNGSTIITAASALFDLNTCFKHVSPKTCTFVYSTPNANQKISTVSHVARAGYQCSGQQYREDDWAVLKLVNPIEDIKPYKLPQEWDGPLDKSRVISVGTDGTSRYLDFIRQQSFITWLQECSVLKILPSYNWPSLLETSCIFSSINFGGALLRKVESEYIFVGLTVASATQSLSKSTKYSSRGATTYQGDTQSIGIPVGQLGASYIFDAISGRN